MHAATSAKGVQIAAGFVEIRNYDGTTLAQGPTSILVGEDVQSLRAMANGELEVLYFVTDQGHRVRMKTSLLFAPLRQVGAQPVPAPIISGLALPDGSVVSQAWGVVNFPTTDELSWRLVKTLPDGTVDVGFGGANRSIISTAFGRIDDADLFGPIQLPDGRLFSAIGIKRRFPVSPVATAVPIGMLANAWLANDGSPDPQWRDPFVSRDVRDISQIQPDGPDGVLVSGSVATGVGDGVTAGLLRIGTADGGLDPGFGQNGVLGVPLRGSENTKAQPSVDLTSGGKIVPVIFREDILHEDFNNVLAWLDII